MTLALFLPLQYLQASIIIEHRESFELCHQRSRILVDIDHHQQHEDSRATNYHSNISPFIRHPSTVSLALDL